MQQMLKKQNDEKKIETTEKRDKKQSAGLWHSYNSELILCLLTNKKHYFSFLVVILSFDFTSKFIASFVLQTNLNPRLSSFTSRSNPKHPKLFWSSPWHILMTIFSTPGSTTNNRSFLHWTANHFWPVQASSLTLCVCRVPAFCTKMVPVCAVAWATGTFDILFWTF